MLVHFYYFIYLNLKFVFCFFAKSAHRAQFESHCYRLLDMFFIYFFAELPITFVTPLADVHVYEKDDARFECEISRQPKSFRWLKGSQEITPDDKFEVLQEGKRHILVVKSAAFEDEAKYLFEAEDKRTSAKLVIQGKGEKIIH